jgi:ABC-type transporter Mla MlaB component
MSEKKRKKSTQDRTLRLEGELTIGRVGEMVSVLNEALDGLKRSVIDLGGVSEIDAAGIQLLCSLHRSAAARHIPVSLAKPLHGRPSQSAVDAGAPCVLESRDFWEACLLRKEVVHE